MLKNDRIIIYGAGHRGKRLCRHIWESGCGIDILAVVDSNSTLWGTQYYGQVIIDPDAILKDTTCPVCISVAQEKAYHAIKAMLISKYDYPIDKIVEYSHLLNDIWDNADMTGIADQVYQNLQTKEVRIIFDLFNGFALGGIESWIRALCTELIKQGYHNLRIYAHKNRFKEKEPPNEWRSLSRITDYIGNNYEYPLERTTNLNAKGYFAQKSPCVLVVNFIDTFYVACSLKRLYPNQIKIIGLIHTDRMATYDDLARMKDDVDVFVVVSRDVQQAMIDRGIEKERVLVMHIPFSCEERLVRSYKEEVTAPIKVGYAGRLDVRAKRVDLLLRLIEALLQRKVNFELEIAGIGGYESEMKDYIAEHHLENCVYLIGRVPSEEIPEFWKRQDICVNISDYEGWCISIAEAMGCGAVPVVTDVAGVVREVVENGRNGFIVPIGNYQEMADRIEYLAEHREMLPIMGGAAHDDIYPISSLESHAQFWDELLSRSIEDINRGCSKQ